MSPTGRPAGPSSGSSCSTTSRLERLLAAQLRRRALASQALAARRQPGEAAGAHAVPAPTASSTISSGESVSWIRSMSERPIRPSSSIRAWTHRTRPAQ